MKVKIIVYTDDIPISENQLASGMNRVNKRLAIAMGTLVNCIIVSYQHITVPKKHVDSELVEKVFFPKIPKGIYKIIKKINKGIEILLKKDLQILFYLELPYVKRKIKSIQADILFTPLGSNIRSYERAIMLSSICKIPLVVYIVDEFENASILSKDLVGKALCDKKLKIWLQQTKKIFVISEGMKEFLKKKYMLESEVLNLPFEKKITPKQSILFLGNVSHFYQDGLRDMLKVIYSYNKVNNTNIVLRLTVSSLDFKIFDSKYLPYIEFSKIDGNVALANEISQSLFCFIPYSFDKKYETMVSTSFPSKTIECLAYAKHIVIYGPDYSSVIRYFEQKNMNTCIKQRNLNSLKTVLEKSIQKEKTHLEYNNVLYDNHRYEAIKKIIKLGISGE